jgi:hypothetical protein
MQGNAVVALGEKLKLEPFLVDPRVNNTDVIIVVHATSSVEIAQG